MRSLAWRMLLIYAKLHHDREGGLASEVAESFFARGTVDAIGQIGSHVSRAHVSRRDTEEWLAALGIVARDCGLDGDQEIPALLAAIEQLKAETRREKFADGAPLESYYVRMKRTSPTLLGRVRKQCEDLLLAARTRSGPLDTAAIQSGCKRLVEEAVHNVENLDSWAVYRSVAEYVDGYADTHGFAFRPKRGGLADSTPMRRQVESLVGACALLEAVEGSSQGAPADVPTGEQTTNLLEVGELFQEMCADWARLLIADVGLTLGICPIVPGESGDARKKGAWLKTNAGEWVDPRQARAAYDSKTGDIMYRLATEE
jgi:hypothetical protein